jgi:hypothetical protein
MFIDQLPGTLVIFNRYIGLADGLEVSTKMGEKDYEMTFSRNFIADQDDIGILIKNLPSLTEGVDSISMVLHNGHVVYTCDCYLDNVHRPDLMNEL